MSTDKESSIFAEIRIRGIRDGRIFQPIAVDIPGLDGRAEFDGVTKAIVDALYQLGVDARERQAVDETETPKPPQQRR